MNTFLSRTSEWQTACCLGTVMTAWLFVPAGAQAQYSRLDESWRWTEYTAESGLPSVRVYGVVETARGIAWANTEMGLAWFDGYQWHQIGLAADDDHTRATEIKATRDGQVYVLRQGLVFRGDQQGFRRVTFTTPDRGTGRLISIAPGRDDLYLLTDSTVIHTVGDTVTETIPLPKGENSARIFRSPDGGLWLAASAGYELENGRWVMRIRNPVRAFAADTAGHVYLAVGSTGRSHDRGVWMFDGQGGKREVSAPDLVVSLTATDDGTVLAVSNNGRIWLKQSGRWRRIRTKQRGLVNPTALSFAGNGDLWTATPHGLYLFRKTNRWSAITLPGTAGEGPVNEILRTDSGTLWLGLADGVVIVDRRLRIRRHIESILGRRLGAVTGLAQGPDGHVWISSGASFEGAFEFDGLNWHHRTEADGLGARYVHRIVRGTERDLWFLGIPGPDSTSEGPGAYRYADGHFTRWSTSEGLPSNYVYAFAADPGTGVLWFGTWGGLSRWQSGQWTHWTTANGLKTDQVFALAIDSSGTVWFAHRNGQTGIGFLDADDQPRYLDHTDGLVDDNVWDLDVASDNTVWLATSNGLSVYRGELLASFGPAEGLLHSKLWPVLAAHDSVYVGTDGGGVYVLDRAEEKTPLPRIEIDPPAVVGRSAAVRWRALSYRGSQPPERIETRFRVNDGEWSPWSTTNRATLLEPPTGTSTVTVQAKGLFGSFREIGGQVSLVIPPPFYARPIFLGALAIWITTWAGFWYASLRRRRLHQQAIFRRNEFLSSLLENASDLITVTDSEHIIRYQSPSSSRVLGLEPEVLIGEKLLDWVHEDDRARTRLMLRSATQSTTVRSVQLRVRDRNGNYRVLHAIGRSFVESDGSTLTIINSRDVTEDRKKEELLRENERKYRLLFEAESDAIILLDAVTLEILDANQAATELYGYTKEELQQMKATELSALPDKARAMIDRVARERFRQIPFALHRKKDGTVFPVEISTGVFDFRGRTAVCSIFRDVTERKVAEEERRGLEARLRQAQKMEALGTLAGGIAHDFNNILLAIVGYTELARDDLPDAPEIRSHLDQVLTAAARAQGLINQILAFSRKSEPELKPVRLGDLVAEVLNLLRATLPSTIEIQSEIEDVGAVNADQSQIHQVILNLGSNAADAMSGHGTLTIKLTRTHVTTRLGGELESLPPGDYALLKVTDTGHGMDNNTVRRMFEPFFTTKGVGRGTGLGLSVVHGIVMGHGGACSVESEPGKGTTFSIYLPLHDAEIPADDSDASISRRVPRSGRVLLVDDEESLARLGARMLERHGYDVAAACDSDEALRLFEADPDSFLAVVTDQTMPKLTGLELAAKIRDIRPDTPIILTTGFSQSVTDQTADSPRISLLLMKPYNGRDLIAAIDSAVAENT